MKAVFLDTVGLIGLWDTADQWHIAATLAFQKLVIANTRLVTTPQVLYECGNTASRKPYRSRVHAMRDALMQEGNVFSPTAEEEEQAWAAYCRGEAGDAGIVDHLSFVVMRRLGSTEAFTHNGHFNAAGFTSLF